MQHSWYKKNFIYTALLIFSCTVIVLAQNKETAIPQVEIAGSQLLHLTSAITNQEYDLYIYLPRGYSDTTKHFPVLFLTDAQWDFSFVQAIYGQQYYDGLIPEMVIVGITWGGKNPDYDKRRSFDLTPTDINNSKMNGNAPRFLSFITNEAIPYIEKHYRVTNDRTLMGSSLGGLFALYALFQEPRTFNRFVFTSPAVQWDNRVIYSIDKQFAENHKEINAKVFIGYGQHEYVPEFQNFIKDLKEKKYKNLELQTQEIEGCGHSGAKAEGYTHGLQFVFARPNIQVDASLLSSYLGEYSVGPMFKIKLIQEDGHLVGVTPDNTKLVLNAASETDFYMTGQFVNIHIDKDPTGKVTGFTLHQYSGDTPFLKTK